MVFRVPNVDNTNETTAYSCKRVDVRRPKSLCGEQHYSKDTNPTPNINISCPSCTSASWISITLSYGIVVCVRESPSWQCWCMISLEWEFFQIRLHNEDQDFILCTLAESLLSSAEAEEKIWIKRPAMQGDLAAFRSPRWRHYHISTVPPGKAHQQRTQPRFKHEPDEWYSPELEWQWTNSLAFAPELHLEVSPMKTGEIR